jgi:hypothetical protein
MLVFSSSNKRSISSLILGNILGQIEIKGAQKRTTAEQRSSLQMPSRSECNTAALSTQGRILSHNILQVCRSGRRRSYQKRSPTTAMLEHSADRVYSTPMYCCTMQELRISHMVVAG